MTPARFHQSPENLLPPEIRTFRKDRRMPLEEIYRLYGNLPNRHWIKEVITSQPVINRQGRRLNIDLPILIIRSKIRGDAVWIIAGVHGEEPAGPNAVGENIRIFEYIRSARKQPMVILPICNPAGYMQDKRYFDSVRGPGTSVTDSDHLVLAPPDFTNTRSGKPIHPIADTISRRVLQLCEIYPPQMVLDFHEDEFIPHVDGKNDDHPQAELPYIYSHVKGSKDPVAQEIRRILEKNSIPLQSDGETRDGHPIINGIVSDGHDGSIDNLLAADRIMRNGEIVEKPGASSVVVVETPIIGVPLRTRIKVHGEIMRAIPRLLDIMRSS